MAISMSLTKCSFDPVGRVLAYAIPAVQVEGADTTRDASDGRKVRAVNILWKNVPDSCNNGWDGTRASISCHASSDAQSAHDERGDSRLRWPVNAQYETPIKSAPNMIVRRTIL